MTIDVHQPRTGHKKYDDLTPRATRELAGSGEKSKDFENIRDSHIWEWT
jgi:hypothetical protein